jgi:aminoglycoside phosphotransferase (APT) family kinase protein
MPGPLPPALLAALERRLGPATGQPTVLAGGITNRNLRLRLGGDDYVVRLSGKETALLGIDRATEVAATRAAHALGLAPEVVAFLPEHECLVTRWVPGRPAQAGGVRARGLLERVATGLRAFHGGGALGHAFDPFALGAVHRAATVRGGGSVPDGFDAASALVLRIQAALTGAEHAPVPCHNDLLSANLLVGGAAELTIVDWEYAGMNDRYFDLGNLAANNGFGDGDDRRLLAAYWGEPPTPPREASLALMRIVSDYREAAWGMVQAVVSELDFDYPRYAREHLTRLLEAAADPRVEEWLHAAAA